MGSGKTDKIVVKGARSHNLKNIDVEIPKDKLVVITGLSGSGKSSLAFDTIYAEGQRKYVESLSSYARQFLGMMEKADVDLIEGLSPAISIDQKSSGHNPRSTVGTITEIYDYLRLLYARAGHPHSPVSGKRLESQTVQQIVDRILAFPKKYGQKKLRIMLLAPVVKNRKGTYEELFQRYLSQGFIRARVNGEMYSLEEDIKLDRYKKHNIDVIVDRLVVEDGKQDEDFVKRLTDSVETALNLGDREILVNIIDEHQDEFFSEKLVDPETGESFQQIEPHTFSFNSPHGACPKCDGLGHIREIDKRLVLNPRLTISEGGLFPWSKMADNADSWHMQLLRAVADSEGFSIREPLGQLSEEHLHTVLYGAGDRKFSFKYTNRSNGSNSTVSVRYEGLIPSLLRRYQQTNSDYIRKDIEQYMHEMECPQCKGARLNNVALAVTIEDTNIYELTHLPLKKFKPWLDRTKSPSGISSTSDSLTKQELTIVKQVFKEIEARVDFLLAVGLDYLSLGRTARTLSGGEAQRIRLASQIGTGLSGVLYVLDEPSIGLHQRDNNRLIKTLQNLRDLGNTILVVEHDKDTILTADHVIDMGPGAGEHGGKIVAEGTPEQIKKNSKSLTGRYLSGKVSINIEEIKSLAKQINNIPDGILKSDEDSKLTLVGAKHNNLKNVTVDFPLGSFISVTGVSGSGKSSLVNETLTRILKRQFYRSKAIPGSYEKLEGTENVDKIVEIDQSAIGRTPRSNPATYTGVFTSIRDIYSQTRESKVRGYKPGRFSFNVRGGRCETCQGDGLLKIEMQFLSDVYVQCDVCKGLRYNRETLQIDYKGKNIAEVLDMTVKTALDFFKNIPSIKNKLITLDQVGLGYIRLGQSATTLSGGEAQRVKLSSELSKRSTGKTVYVLDEPTTGLHIDDIKKLLVVLHSLVERGNTVIVIE
ncbi:MAG: excinuclease ABC subunit UvrA, partial [Candidatus Dojkabacteria bacterium]